MGLFDWLGARGVRRGHREHTSGSGADATLCLGQDRPAGHYGHRSDHRYQWTVGLAWSTYLSATYVWSSHLPPFLEIPPTGLLKAATATDHWLLMDSITTNLQLINCYWYNCCLCNYYTCNYVNFRHDFTPLSPLVKSYYTIRFVYNKTISVSGLIDCRIKTTLLRARFLSQPPFPPFKIFNNIIKKISYCFS